MVSTVIPTSFSQLASKYLLPFLATGSDSGQRKMPSVHSALSPGVRCFFSKSIVQFVGFPSSSLYGGSLPPLLGSYLRCYGSCVLALGFFILFWFTDIQESNLCLHSSIFRFLIMNKQVRFHTSIIFKTKKASKLHWMSAIKCCLAILLSVMHHVLLWKTKWQWNTVFLWAMLSLWNPDQFLPHKSRSRSKVMSDIHLWKRLSSLTIDTLALCRFLDMWLE